MCMYLYPLSNYICMNNFNTPLLKIVNSNFWSIYRWSTCLNNCHKLVGMIAKPQVYYWTGGDLRLVQSIMSITISTFVKYILHNKKNIEQLYSNTFTDETVVTHMTNLGEHTCNTPSHYHSVKSWLKNILRYNF